MLSIRTIREEGARVRKALEDRGVDLDLDRLIRLDDRRRELLRETEDLRHRRNEASREVGRIKREGGDASGIMEEMRRVGARIKELEGELKAVESELESLLLQVPNIPHDTVPVGRDDTQNRVERVWGEPPAFDFEPLPHWELGDRLGILDFERAAKITGARFVVLKGLGARLERALIQFMLDLHVREHGYEEVWPPFMVNARAMRGTGQLPKFEEDLFHVTGTDYYLVPTAEVPVTNLHAGEVLKEDDLPLCYTAYTPCFRAEAGAYGKDTRGMIRQHQFDKVELVKFAHPDT